MDERSVSPGDVVMFDYDSDRSTEPSPIVFVVQPSWQGKLHGVHLTALPDSLRRVVLGPLRRYLVDSGISPYDFYHRHVKPIDRRYGAYRSWRHDRMGNVRIVDIVPDGGSRSRVADRANALRGGR